MHIAAPDGKWQRIKIATERGSQARFMSKRQVAHTVVACTWSGFCEY